MHFSFVLPAGSIRRALAGMVLGIALAGHTAGAPAAPEIEDLRRIYDIAPVSATNPVVARVTDRTLQRLKSSEGQKAVRKWYDTHLKDRYTFKDSEGKERTVSFEAERESIENDYFDGLREEVRSHEVRALRNNRDVEIEQELLEELPIGCNVSAPDPDRN